LLLAEATIVKKSEEKKERATMRVVTPVLRRPSMPPT